MAKPLHLELLGRKLTLKTDESSEKVESMVAYLEETLASVKKSSAAVDTVHIALLAALNVTRELFEANERLEAQADQVEARSRELLEKMGD